MSLSPGTKLAHYEVVESMGAGGMGEVYRARDTRLGRDVAIKVLPEELARDEERLDRFEREARLLAQLNHPNIATLHGFEEHDGRRFLVMELVEGETLAERIARGCIPVDEAMPLFIQIAEGLEAAHEKGIIHRDLKPANLKIGPDGKPKILDFGLAKAFAGDTGAAPDSSQSPTLTKGTAMGVILGTPSYMSPEQARGKQVDHRTDIWALGCVMFETLTSKRCFLGETVTDTLAAVVHAEPDFSELPETTPAQLRELTARCLNKNPRQRLQHVGDARLTMEEALSAPRLTKPVVRRHGAVSYAVAGAAALLGATSTWIFTSSSPSNLNAVTRTVISLGTVEGLALGTTTSVAISPDGRSIVYVGRREETTRLYLRRLDELEPEIIPATDGGAMPFFSPDGRWVAFQQGDELMRVSLGGGAPIAIAGSGLGIRGASWSPDGTIVLTQSASGRLASVPADGGELIPLTSLDREKNEKSHRFAEVLPGGNAILFTVGTNSMRTWDEAAIGVLDLHSGRYRILVEGGTSPRFSRSGHVVYARSGSLLAVAFDPGTLQVKGVPVTVLDGVATSPANGQAEYAISGSGSLVYAPGGSWGDDYRVVSVDRDGNVEPLIETTRAFLSARVSPGGESLAVVIDGANESVWLYERARGILTQLAAGYNRGEPIWTSNGERLVFYSVQTEVAEIYWRIADGSAPAERLAGGERPRLPSSFAPDGKTLLFVERHPDTGWDIWTLGLEGERTESPVLQTEFNEAHPAIAPDGRWMAYDSDESGQLEIYVRPFPVPGRKWQVSTAGGTKPRWNPNGGELFYRQGDKLMEVTIRVDRELELGTPRELFERPSPRGEYDVFPDGERFVMADTSLSRKAPTHLILVQNFDDELKRLVPH